MRTEHESKPLQLKLIHSYKFWKTELPGRKNKVRNSNES